MLTSGALRPPAGLVLGLGALVLVATFTSDQLASLRDAAPEFALFTLVCWLLLALGQLGSGAALAAVRNQDLLTVRQMRQDMDARISALPADSPLRREFPDILQRLDREIIPKLAELCAKHDELGRRLQQYDRASAAYRPDASTLARLKALHGRQAGVIQGLVQQVVNMDAALLGLIQEGDEQQMIGKVREWAQEIDFRWQGVAEVLSEDTPAPAPPPSQRKA